MLDDNDKKVISELIATSLKANQSEMQEYFNNQLSGSNNRTWESIEKKFSKLDIEGKLQPILDQVNKQNEVITKLANNAGGNTNSDTTGNNTSNSDNGAGTGNPLDDVKYQQLINKFEESQKNQASEIQSLRKDLKENEQKRLQAETARDKERARTSFITASSEKGVLNPEDFYTLLEAKGAFEYKDGKLVVPTEKYDDRGQIIEIDATENVSAFLDQYPNFKKARGGTGTGSGPGEQNGQTKTAHLKEYASQSGFVDGTDFYEKMQTDPNLFNEALGELKDNL